MIFSCINGCQVPRDMMKTETVPDPEGDAENQNRGRGPRFSTSPEGPDKP